MKYLKWFLKGLVITICFACFLAVFYSICTLGFMYTVHRYLEIQQWFMLVK